MANDINGNFPTNIDYSSYIQSAKDAIFKIESSVIAKEIKKLSSESSPEDWEKIKKQHNHMIREELALGITRRLRSLIRPLDSLCRISDDQYAVIAHFTHIDYCTTGSYRRIHDGINLKSFKTISGYISVNAASSVCTIDDQSDSPSIEDVESHCQGQVQQAINTGTIVISKWKKAVRASYS